MPVPPLSVRLRLGALVLMASVLPLAVQAPAPTGGAMAHARPARWLRAQVGSVAAGAAPAHEQDARATFEQALAKATAADTHTLHGFLTAFLDAHAALTNAEAPETEGRSARALIAALRRQLAKAGLSVRPSTQMSAPPTAPTEQAYWMEAVSLLPSLSGGSSSTGASSARSQSAFAPALASSLAGHVAALVPRGALLCVLFAGRRLGP